MEERNWLMHCSGAAARKNSYKSMLDQQNQNCQTHYNFKLFNYG